MGVMTTLSLIVGVLVAWSAVQLKAIDWIIGHNIKQFQERFESTEKRIEKLEVAIADVRRDYVKREDWVQFSTAVQAKLDVVSARLDAMVTMERRHG